MLSTDQSSSIRCVGNFNENTLIPIPGTAKMFCSNTFARILCSVHLTLRSSDPATTTIADVAMEQGFLNLGRFSGYYRSLFDECPSRTLAGFDCPTHRCGDCPQIQRAFPDSAQIRPD
jgi:hypothetical protein